MMDSAWAAGGGGASPTTRVGRVPGGAALPEEQVRRAEREGRVVLVAAPRLVGQERIAAARRRNVEAARVLDLVQVVGDVGAQLQVAAGHVLQAGAEDERKRGAELV